MKVNEFVGRFGLNSFKAAMVCPQFNRYEYAILYSDEVDFSNDLIEKHKNYMFKTSEIRCLVESHELIEKLGGYESAKSKLRDNGSLHAERLKKALLEYRRQHKIYEVGDKVCCRGGIKQNPFWDLNSIFTIKEIWDGEIDLITSDDDLGCFPMRPHQIGHATDAEIEAGKRLEVESEN